MAIQHIAARPSRPRRDALGLRESRQSRLEITVSPEHPFDPDAELITFRPAYNDAMARSRRDFLAGASAVMATAAACKKPKQKAGADAPPAGAPPSFGTSPAVGPPALTGTFAE